MYVCMQKLYVDQTHDDTSSAVLSADVAIDDICRICSTSIRRVHVAWVDLERGKRAGQILLLLFLG